MVYSQVKSVTVVFTRFLLFFIIFNQKLQRDIKPFPPSLSHSCMLKKIIVI